MPAISASQESTDVESAEHLGAAHAGCHLAPSLVEELEVDVSASQMRKSGHEGAHGTDRRRRRFPFPSSGVQGGINGALLPTSILNPRHRFHSCLRDEHAAAERGGRSVRALQRATQNHQAVIETGSDLT
jgi:hypothetical protein